ncbi:uncharacterized protein LOC110820304 isoform X1 [Carica papaya]|uniref:uncharacterized protein LOC110820304 isoform X1 n=1 Tax=Carica papaya TaxID=3649 RepID=UPI000B8CBFBA|nr:uncharacterized protein LOC110820304 isoform X1 [Carica papaya]
MAATSRAFVLSRFTDVPSKKLLHPPHPPPALPHRLCRRRTGVNVATVTSCLSSGGVSDDYFVSTRKIGLDRGFAVIANMLRRIEPLDTSIISKGVSDSAKDSMKQTISSMLGLLPSDQFSVSVTVSEQPLHRLLISSIITGYTLWNAEYRVSLIRNLDIPVQRGDKRTQRESFDLKDRQTERESGIEELETIRPQVFGDLSPEALNSIQRLQSELSCVKEELNAQKQEKRRMENEKSSRNDLLEYLRSLDPELVNLFFLCKEILSAFLDSHISQNIFALLIGRQVSELSQPSSSEVEEIIHQLVHGLLQRFFKDEATSNFMGGSAIRSTRTDHDAGDESRTVGTSRDYLAKLLFWCMLLGHHLRGLENRLHLSCVVGLL